MKRLVSRLLAWSKAFRLAAPVRSASRSQPPFFLPAIESLEDRNLLNTDISIVNSGLGTTVGGSFSAGGAFTPSAANAVIANADIQAFLNAGTNVTINTTSAYASPGAITEGTGATITASPGASATLSLTANTDIVISSAISATSGALSANLTAGGTETISAAISTNGATIALNAGGTITEATGGTLSTSGSLAVSATGGITLTNANSVSTFAAVNNSGGSVNLTNTAATLTIAGIAQNGTSAGSDIFVVTTGNLTTTGAITTTASANGDVNLNADEGAMTIGANVTAGGSGTVYLQNTGSGAPMLIDAAVQSVGSAIAITSNGTITEGTGGWFSTSIGLTTASSGGQSLTGANTVGKFLATNDTGGAISLTNSGSVSISGTGITQSGTAAGSDVTVTTTGNLTINSITTTAAANGNISLTAINGALTIAGGLTAGGSGAIMLCATGTASNLNINGALESTSGNIAATAAGTINIATSNIGTAGTQLYSGAVNLGSTTALAGSTVTFDNTIASGGNDLTVSGNGVFSGTVANVGNLLVTGTTTIRANVTSTGSQNYSGDVTLLADTTCTGGAITFGGRIDGAHALTALSGGTIAFDGTIGALAELTGLTTGGGGTTAINTAAINLAGSQTYNENISLGANTQLTANDNTITFGGTIDGAQTLTTVTSNGVTTFDGIVGGTTPLTSLSTANAGSTVINTTAITTTGTQSYNNTITTAAGTTLLTSTGNQVIRFNSTVNAGGMGAAGTLALASTAVTTFSGTTTFQVDVNGPTNVDALVNTASGGGITLGGATLNVNVLAFAGGHVYTIVASPVGGIGGTFAGLPNGATFTADGHLFQISYTPTAVTLTSLEPPTITSAGDTTFTVGTVSSFQVLATGIPGSMTFSETGALPSGVTFTSSGDLSGKPAVTTGGSYPLAITADNGVSPVAVQNFTLSVDEAPVITTGTFSTFTVGAAGSFPFVATGFPAAAFTPSGSLPSGVTLSSDGVLSGTPAGGTGGIYPLTITASNGVNYDATQNFTLTINEAPTFTSVSSTAFTIGSAGSFTVTTGHLFPTLTTLSETGNLPTGVTFIGNGNGTATLAGTPTAGTSGTFTITITAHNGVMPDAMQTFTLAVDQTPVITSGTYARFTVGTAGSFPITAISFPAATFSETGALPQGVALDPSTGLLSGTPASGTGGTYPITITASNGIVPGNTQTFTLQVIGAPTFTSSNTTTFTVGMVGSFTVTANGLPLPILTETGTLPSGVKFNSMTGVLSGSPAAHTGRAYHITLKAINGIAPIATQSFTLNVDEAPTFISAAKTTFTVGKAASFAVKISGFPAATFSETGALPTGITLNPSTGLLSGTAASGTGGIYPITITAGNGTAPDATQSFTLTVHQAPAITSSNNATFTVGTAGSFTVTASGFPAVKLSEIGALPKGLTWSATTGVLSGTPVAGTGRSYLLTFEASNGVAPNAVQHFTLNVDQAPVITSVAQTTFTVGKVGSFTIKASGFPAATFSESGALPIGVVWNPLTGVLKGTPAAGTNGFYTLTFTASNGVTPDAVQTFTLEIV